jgi:uncharacterized protein (DUF488 family)
MTIVFTIGHSSHDWPTFQQLYERADIGAIADLRSKPVSRFPHFNRAALRQRLNLSGVAYLHMGNELGGRAKGGGALDYERMAASVLFVDGIAQVERIAARANLALLCSEHEPLTCHRCLLVGRRLAERGVSVGHILRDGSIEANAATEERLLVLTRQTERDLLASRADRLAAAYRSQELRIMRSKR